MVTLFPFHLPKKSISEPAPHLSRNLAAHTGGGSRLQSKRRSDNFPTYRDKRTNRPSPLHHAPSHPPRPRRSEKIYSPQPLPSLIKAGGKKLEFRIESGNLICVYHRAPSARPRPARPLQRASTTPPLIPGSTNQRSEHTSIT